MKKILCITFLFFFFLTSGFTQEESPTWLLMEKGKEAYQRRELGIALEFFREALSQKGPYPEAEMWIGKVFEQEGLFELALEQYAKALKASGSFTIPDEKYLLLYTIAGLYEKKGDMKSMNDTLIQIVSEDPYYFDSRYDSMRTNMLQFITRANEGLNKILLLYRISPSFSLEAHRKLGYYYYQWNRGDRLIHLLIPVVSIFSKLVEELKKIEPEYTFVSVEQCLEDISFYSPLVQYVKEQELYTMLFFLGDSVAYERRLNAAINIWSIVAEFSDDEALFAAAQRRIADPTIEPPTVILE